MTVESVRNAPVTAEAAADLAADGVVYAELRFAPELQAACRLEPLSTRCKAASGPGRQPRKAMEIGAVTTMAGHASFRTCAGAFRPRCVATSSSSPMQVTKFTG